MKRIISLWMVFLLIFTMGGPLPGYAEKVDFPGSVTGSDVDADKNLGAVKVSMNGGNGNWMLTLQKLYGAKDQQGDALPEGSDTFSNVPPGLYHVRAEDKTDKTNIKVSAPVTVKPRALSVSSSNGQSPNVITPANEPYKIEVKNATTNSEIRLYIDDQAENYRKATVDSTGSAIFNGIEARSTYRLTQVINEAESEKSGEVTVNPTDVKIEWKKNSGQSNNTGELLVTGTKKNNILILYRGGNEFRNAVSDTATFTFDKLPEGTYTVKQKENGVISKGDSNPVKILNEQLPIIDLVDGENYNLSYKIDKEGQITKLKYQEPGYEITDKNGSVYTGKTSKLFCTNNTVDIIDDDTVNVCSPLQMKVIVKSTVPGGGDETPTPPGRYTVTYTATDGENPSLITSAIRNITIFPNEVILAKTDTQKTHGTSPIEEHINGKIIVKGVLAGAKLLLYQDPSGSNKIENAKLIRSNAEVNDGEYSFSKIPVGSGYFVVQEVNEVQSKSSERIDIVDTTPPVLKLNRPEPIELEVGDQYVEYSATAIDNIDTSAELANRIHIDGTVNTNLPGKYEIIYNVKDKAGNEAVGADGKTPAAVRTVIVKPKSVTAIGSIASLGEIGVKDIFPGTTNRPTTLKLYKYDVQSDKFKPVTKKDSNNIDIPIEINLQDATTTYIFSKFGPGRYYVTQTINKQESKQSNIVEIVDIDRPYITLDGPEKIKLIWEEESLPYYKKDSMDSKYKFTDTGAIANDYLGADKLILSAFIVGPDQKDMNSGFTQGNLEPTGKPIKVNRTLLSEPGTYKITYTAKAERGSVADSKYRTITLAPPKIKSENNNIKADPGGTIQIAGSVFNHQTTVVNLYNTYNQMIDSQEVKNNTSATFAAVPAGIGYYVTQTVNGIESAPSDPVNVSLFEDAKGPTLITSFSIKYTSGTVEGIIDQETGEIAVIVPKGTDRTKLVPDYTIIGKKMQGPTKGAASDFSKIVDYKVTAENDTTITKNYKVKVIESNNNSTIAKGTVMKNIEIKLSQPEIALSQAERMAAAEKGITFITTDKAIYVPAGNVKESSHAILTVKSPNKSTVELNWGNSASFIQPIELDMPNPDNKAFARTVLENGKTYTVIQPSDKNGKNLIGMATDPGNYTLVEPVAKPFISTNIVNEKPTYRIYTGLSGGDIYYTTSSNQISFNRSGREESFNSYTIDSVQAVLSDWTPYKGETITSPTGELYAVVVKDQAISQVEAKISIAPTEWRKNTPTYPTHKVLSVTFNTKVDKKALYAGTIYVVDNSTGKKVETTLSLSADGKTIKVAPKNAYTRGKQYTLHIDRQFKGNTKNKEFLKQPLTQTFFVE